VKLTYGKWEVDLINRLRGSPGLALVMLLNFWPTGVEAQDCFEHSLERYVECSQRVPFDAPTADILRNEQYCSASRAQRDANCQERSKRCAKGQEQLAECMMKTDPFEQKMCRNPADINLTYCNNS
jgi:hypothetical protein